MENAIDKAYRGYRWFLEVIIGNIAAVVMLSATGLAISEIVRRYVIGVTFQWGQDAVTYILVSALFLFFAVTQARRSHLCVEVVVDLLKKRGMTRLILFMRSFVSLLQVALFSALAWWGVPTIKRSILTERTTDSIMLYIYPFQVALAVGLALMAIGALFHLYQDVNALRGKEVFKWAPVEEGIEI